MVSQYLIPTLFVVFSALFVFQASGLVRNDSFGDIPVNASSPMKLKNDKSFSFNATRAECPGVTSCPQVYFYFEVSSETFRSSDRDVKLKVWNQGSSCYDEACASSDVLVTINKMGSTSFLLEQNVTDSMAYKKTKSFKDETKYVVTLNQPKGMVRWWSAQVEVEWETGTPNWVIAVFVVGGLIVLIFIGALIWCLCKCGKKSGYEEFR